MKTRSLIFATLFFVVGLPSLVWGATCKPSDLKDTRCTLHVTQIRPAQFAVGSVAVDCKAAEISAKSEKKLEKYLKGEKRQVPAVVGPDGNFYMTDHHHLSTALHRAKSEKWGSKKKVLHLRIIENYNEKGVSWAEFWNEMQAQHYSYNFDNKGIPNMNYALLPKDVSGMLNDPYRTLSRWVRESCGYVKAGKEQCDGIRTDPPHEAPFFMEFYWGDFFRKNLHLQTADLEVCKSIPYSPTCLDDEVDQLKGIYEEAMKLAASQKAKDFFEGQGLDPWKYGYNATGERLKLTWGGKDDACEEVR